jgi:hypothetical protein
LPLAVLGARGLQALGLRPLAALAIATLALAETLIVPIPMPEWTKIIDTRQAPPAVYSWLAEQPGREPIVHLPMLDVRGLERRPRFHESVYMVYSTRHWRPLVNGYAGIEPSAYVRMRELAGGFPSSDFTEAMRAIGVRYVVLHRAGYGPNQWPRVEQALPGATGDLREVAAFGDDRVYELRPLASMPEAAVER